ncbi:MAG: ABC transporter permease [Cyclobacteriaceae bacterium]|nr:ABC transporter permease [Cyclobacteriaceae bacterium HetDA_MAG_MS6]
MNQVRPPRFFVKFLGWYCRDALQESILGDLEEQFDQDIEKSGINAANRRFAWNVICFFRPGIIKSFDIELNKTIYISMLINYLKYSLRNIQKHKGFSAINALSLSIGIAACLVIFLFIQDEVSFDSMHSKNVYRLCEVQSFPGTNTQKVALTMAGMGPTMTELFPEVSDFTRFWNYGNQLIKAGDKNLVVEKVVAVDTSFFNVFDFPLRYGDPIGVINQPFDAVLSVETALKLFGREDVVGEVFRSGDEQFMVRGVMEDVPGNSHLQFDMVIAISSYTRDNENFDRQFGSNYLNTYLVLNENVDLAQMATKFPDFLLENSGREDITERYKLFVQPLDEVHLRSTDIEHDYNNHRKFNGEYIRIFVLVGIFILLIASVNFMNLTTARASGRAKDVGVRKSVGAVRAQVFSQFLVESAFLAFMAFILAVLLTVIALPFLNDLIDRQLSLISFLVDPWLPLVIVGMVLLLGLLAGLYPSVYLSSFRPVVVLKGLKVYEKKSIFRSSLVVLQFSLALGMIVGTLVVVRQLMYMKNKDIGFSKDHILLVNLNEQASEHYEQIKDELLKKSTVVGVTASGQRLGNNFHQWGFKVRKDTGIVNVTPSNVFVDYNYLDIYEIKLLQGRTFSRDYATDDGLAYIINESFAKELGLDDPIGQTAGHGWYPDDSLGSIIGVVEDFNFNSLHYKVNTLSMVVHSSWGYSEMSVKLNGQNIQQGIKDVEEVYNQFVTDYPIKYEFLDDHFQQLYRSDAQMASVVTIMAILSISVGFMGLFGLASITIQRRVKEVGIRKVMGATVPDLMSLLTKNFVVLVLMSFVLAVPITYILLSQWLENFAYRITISPFTFVLGGAMSLLVALVTVSFHVIKAAYSNPIESLKYE